MIFFLPLSHIPPCYLLTLPISHVRLTDNVGTRPSHPDTVRHSAVNKEWHPSSCVPQHMISPTHIFMDIIWYYMILYVQIMTKFEVQNQSTEGKRHATNCPNYRAKLLFTRWIVLSVVIKWTCRLLYINIIMCNIVPKKTTSMGTVHILLARAASELKASFILSKHINW